MRMPAVATATALMAAISASGAAASAGDTYDMERFLEEKHPFPGTYATPSRESGKRPNLPSREVGPDRSVAERRDGGENDTGAADERPATEEKDGSD